MIYLNLRLLPILLLGFASGLPFLSTLSTLSFWLTELGVSNTLIGFMMGASIPYSLKFTWAFFFDRFSIPVLSRLLGRRRSWCLMAQLGLMAALLLMSRIQDPSQALLWTGFVAFLIAFFAASQDIVIDAYRIEMMTGPLQGPGAAVETIGFRCGMLASGAGALYLAAAFDWQTAYLCLTLLVGVGILTVLGMPEPPMEPNHRGDFSSSSLGQFWRSYFAPWKAFIHRKDFYYLLLFVIFFKLADVVLNAMSAPFLHSLGVSKVEFANVSKVFGIAMMVFGSLVAGLVIARWGIWTSLITCGLIQLISCLLFAFQSLVGHDLIVLIISIGVESLGSGMTAAACIALFSRYCRAPFTATHFTLLSSISSLTRVVLSGVAGILADVLTWTPLFFLLGILCIPVLYLAGRLQEAKER